ncbi:MAG: hypothetical protein WCD52_04345, partial [Xanthobacteraceae bacterium]
DYRDYFFKGRRSCLCQPCRERAARDRRKKKPAKKSAAGGSRRKRKIVGRKTSRKGTAKRRS